MNTYRVDRACAPVTPCGMNSIIYLGDDFKDAQYAYHQAQTGISTWGGLNAAYGVILSVWDGRTYVVKMRKGLDN